MVTFVRIVSWMFYTFTLFVLYALAVNTADPNKVFVVTGLALFNVVSSVNLIYLGRTKRKEN